MQLIVAEIQDEIADELRLEEYRSVPKRVSALAILAGDANPRTSERALAELAFLAYRWKHKEADRILSQALAAPDEALIIRAMDSLAGYASPPRECAATFAALRKLSERSGHELVRNRACTLAGRFPEDPRVSVPLR